MSEKKEKSNPESCLGCLFIAIPCILLVLFLLLGCSSEVSQEETDPDLKPCQLDAGACFPPEYPAAGKCREGLCCSPSECWE